MSSEDARFEGLLSVMDRIIREPEAERRIAEDPGAWLAEGGLGEADVESLVAAGPQRLLFYRKLARKGLTRAIRVEIPRTAARLGEVFDAHVARYVEEEAPRSHYLRDVAFEFVAWAAPRWAEDDTVPSYLADLARHELSAFEVAAAPADEAAAIAEPGRNPADGLALDRGALFDASARLFRYAHAVHRLEAAEEARDLPAREPTALLGYRDVEHGLRYLELTPLAAAILERLLGAEALEAAVSEGCRALGHAVDAAVLESTAALLTELGRRGVILGCAPHGE